MEETKDMNIYRAAELLKAPERRIIDFSSPVNPLGPSKKIKAELRKHLKYLRYIPDPKCIRMRRHIARHLNLDMDDVICGNESAELLHKIISTIRPGKVLVPSPASPEYEKAFVYSRLMNKEYTKSESIKQAVSYIGLNSEDNFSLPVNEFITGMDQCDMAFLPNPNDTTGSLVRKEKMIEISETAREKRCYLLVDETFIDFIRGESVVDAFQDNPYLIVMRSFTPFHSFPGLGADFAVMNRDLIKRINEHHPMGSVNSLAQRAAVIALKDKAYKRESDQLMKEEKAFLEKGFKKLGLEYFPSSANYYLLRFHGASKLYDYLLKRYILVSKCDDIKGLNEDYFRVAVKNHRENSVLIKMIREFLADNKG